MQTRDDDDGKQKFFPSPTPSSWLQSLDGAVTKKLLGVVQWSESEWNKKLAIAALHPSSGVNETPDNCNIEIRYKPLSSLDCDNSSSEIKMKLYDIPNNLKVMAFWLAAKANTYFVTIQKLRFIRLFTHRQKRVFDSSCSFWLAVSGMKWDEQLGLCFGSV